MAVVTLDNSLSKACHLGLHFLIVERQCPFGIQGLGLMPKKLRILGVTLQTHKILTILNLSS